MPCPPPEAWETCVPSLCCHAPYLSASVTLQVRPNWRHRQGGLSSQAGRHCALFAFKHSWLPLPFLSHCTSHPNIWLTLESCSETMMTSVVRKCWQYICTTLWFCFPWMLEDCKVAKGMGYWLVSFGALCLQIREILFWTWILVLWMWLLPTNSLPPYSTVLCHSGTSR